MTLNLQWNLAAGDSKELKSPDKSASNEFHIFNLLPLKKSEPWRNIHRYHEQWQTWSFILLLLNFSLFEYKIHHSLWTTTERLSYSYIVSFGSQRPNIGWPWTYSGTWLQEIRRNWNRRINLLVMNFIFSICCHLKRVSHDETFIGTMNNDRLDRLYFCCWIFPCLSTKYITAFERQQKDLLWSCKLWPSCNQ